VKPSVEQRGKSIVKKKGDPGGEAGGKKSGNGKKSGGEPTLREPKGYGRRKKRPGTPE